jgi:5'-nucleotidase
VGPERLKKFAEQARFPILASNTEGVHFVRKHLQVDLGGVRLCLVGVTTSEPNPFANATIYNEDSVLIYASDLKRQGVCHHVVLMSHAGMPVDKALAQSSHIDLILGGHSHFITGASGNPESVEFGSAILAAPFFYYNDTTVPIVHVGSYGRYVGLIKLDLKSSFKMEGHLLPLDIEHGVFPDEDMEAWIQKEMSSETEDPSITVPLYVEASQNEVCGFICRNRECLLGNLAADAMSHAVKGMFPDHPVIALLESGTLRDCVSHREDFSSVFPWPNHLVVLSVNGSILLDMLEHGLRQPGGGAFLQTSGVRYRYRSKTLLQGSLDPFPAVIQTEAGGSVLAAIQYDSPCALVENATLVQNGSFYHVVVTDWLASGGDGFSMAEAAQKQVLANLTLRKVVLDYITQVSPRIYLDRRSCAIRVATASSNAMAGLIGGYVSFFASYPLYTLFVRRSIKHGSTRKTGLYQGVFLGSMATAFCQFIYFLIYYSESLEHGISSFWRSTIGAVSTVVATNPLWVVVTKVQMMPHGGTVQAIHAVLKESGFSGFFKGIAMNLAMCCFPVVRQIVMEALLKRIGGSDENPAYVALAAGIAACAATFVTLPIQRWRVRLQQGLVDGITMSHLYDGLLFKMAHSAFSSFVLFIVKVSLDDINLAAFLSD